jgi:hypothetical protein
MKRVAKLLIALSVTGCATQYSAQKPSPNSPEIIYAIPQSQAFAIANGAILSAGSRCGADNVHIEKISRGDGLRGYEAEYRSWFYRFWMQRHIWVVPTGGIAAASGQQVDGFRFEITYRYARGLRAEYPRLPGGGCEKTLIGALHAALDATGAATSVTSLVTRQYGEGLGRYSTSQ